MERVHVQRDERLLVKGAMHRRPHFVKGLGLIDIFWTIDAKLKFSINGPITYRHRAASYTFSDRHYIALTLP